MFAHILPHLGIAEYKMHAASAKTGKAHKNKIP